ncbi:uncharacterized protein LOC127286933 isoform X1 [Leptopilina boulardi]|uniref:uncharacterized protein LOC127286933 isoform X1 n=1 Tax=Leptopilina boulardi TaxID=63433 RepID=UPI0021F68B9F|nr:uncharacterized protein LOC127286933 isoform X1 [Leptopilina boulardi]
MEFFQSLVAHLNGFDDDEIHDFKMRVLQVMSSIKDKKMMVYQSTYIASPFTGYQHNPFTVMQPPPQIQSSPISRTYSNTSPRHSPYPQREATSHPSSSYTYYDNLHNVPSPQNPYSLPSPSSASMSSENSNDYSTQN